MRGQERQISRRKFLGSMVGSAIGAGALLATKAVPGAGAQSVQNSSYHSAWVWRFDDDGPPDAIRSVLAQNRLGIILKTHEETDWMPTLGVSPDGQGPDAGQQIQALIRYFEAGGVPFHAWCVVTGRDPIGEARMAAAVLAAGARSISIDLEPLDDGSFWQGTSDGALQYGRELRRLQPNGWVAVAPDPRPWQIDALPMDEFASFSNEIAPQTYWRTFNTPSNYRLLRDHGYDVGPDGVTPELILDVTQSYLGHYRLPIRPIGQGAADPPSWQRFISHAYQLGMSSVSMWRFRTADPGIWEVLRSMPPSQKPAPRSSTPPPLVIASPLKPMDTKPADTKPADSQPPDTTAGPAPVVPPSIDALPRPAFVSPNAPFRGLTDSPTGFDALRDGSGPIVGPSPAPIDQRKTFFGILKLGGVTP